jgi:glutamate carboxypeptidase
MPAAQGQRSEAEQRVCEAIDRRLDAMLEDLRTVVAIPTGRNHTPGLDEYRDWMVRRLRALGAVAEEIPGDPSPDWLYGATDGPAPPTVVCRRQTGSGPRILIACHLDTVFDPADPFREMTLSLDGATASGPGVIDMKGGTIMALHVLEALEDAGLRLSWTFLLNSDEETGSHHSRQTLLDEAARHDVGLATEPALADGSLAIERMGSGQFQIETVGRSAHTGRAFREGVSAVNALADAILKAAAVADPDEGRLVNIGPLRGGSTLNAVPDHALAWGEMRFPTQEKADEIRGMLERIQTSDETDLPRVLIRMVFGRPAKPLAPQTEALGLLAREAAEAAGQPLPFASTGGVCDGNILQAGGLPTIDTLGVRGAGMHTRGERLEVDSLTERGRMFALLLMRLAERGLPWSATP